MCLVTSVIGICIFSWFTSLVVTAWVLQNLRVNVYQNVVRAQIGNGMCCVQLHLDILRNCDSRVVSGTRVAQFTPKEFL